MGSSVWARSLFELTPVDVVVGAVPSLLLNYPIGKPGSLFTLTGYDFPASSPLALTVNGAALPTTAVTTQAVGSSCSLIAPGRTRASTP